MLPNRAVNNTSIYLVIAILESITMLVIQTMWSTDSGPSNLGHNPLYKIYSTELNKQQGKNLVT